MKETLVTTITECAQMLGHSIWIGTISALIYYLCIRVSNFLKPAYRVWVGLSLMTAVPLASFYFAIFGLYRIPFRIHLPVAIPAWLVAWAFILWMVGMSICLSRFVYNYYTSRRIRKVEAIQLDDDDIRRAETHARSRLQIKNRCKICSGKSISGPVLTGLLNPVILLPQEIIGQNRSCIDSIVMHEFAHLKRGDLWQNLYQRVIEAIYFFHPGVRWLSSEIRTEREKACDDLAVAMLGDRLAYAAALLETEEAVGTAPLLLAFGDTTGDRATRIAFEANQKSRVVDALLGLISFSIIVVLVFSAVSFFRVNADLDKTRPHDLTSPSGISIRPTPAPILTPSFEGAIWTDRKIGDRVIPMMKSVLLIEKNGKIFDLTKEKPRLFPKFANNWLVEHEIDWLSHTMPHEDPDGDHFTNLEEYRANTDPNNGDSAPNRVHLLEYIESEYLAYKIRFSARTDERTVQLTRLKSERDNKLDFFLRVGQTSPDQFLTLKKITGNSVVVQNQKTKSELEVEKQSFGEFRTLFAKLSIRGGGLFVVQEGTVFDISGDRSNKWKLSTVDEKFCVLEKQGGKPQTITLERQSNDTNLLYDNRPADSSGEHY